MKISCNPKGVAEKVIEFTLVIHMNIGVRQNVIKLSSSFLVYHWDYVKFSVLLLRENTKFSNWKLVDYLI